MESTEKGFKTALILNSNETRVSVKFLLWKEAKALRHIPFNQNFGNSGSKSKGKESFLKFISKISVNLSRLSFFPGIWKSRNFLFHLAFPPAMNRL